MKTKENEIGITLIALVVTVVILIILAGVSVSMLGGENGILNRTQEAKKSSKEASEKEMIELAVLEVITEENGSIKKGILERKLKSILNQEILLEGDGPWQFSANDGAYIVSTTGNVVKGWIYIYDENGVPKQVTNGSMILNIGDYVNYNPITNTSYVSEIGINQKTTEQYTTTGPDWSGSEKNWECYKASDYQNLLENCNDLAVKNKGNGYEEKEFYAKDIPNDINWRVLGVDEEKGELLIFATKNVANVTFSGITGYLYGVDELNNICDVYGHGKGATGGKSLTFEMVNKLIGKNVSEPKNYNLSWESNYINVWMQGNKHALYFSHIITGTNTGIFNYYDRSTKKWTTNTQDLTQIQDDSNFTTMTIDFKGYGYGEMSDAQMSTNGYDVIFKANGADIKKDDQYWLGSSFTNIDYDGKYWGYVTNGLYYIQYSNCVSGYGLYSSFGYLNEPNFRNKTSGFFAK